MSGANRAALVLNGAGAAALIDAAHAMAEAAKAQTQTAEAIMQIAAQLSRPVEIQRDPATGKKRAVRVQGD